ncbi:beta strand repeat-containing protein [Stenomitos frigidus]|nr:hypothetical protein [Stenomitos frigidus]
MSRVKSRSLLKWMRRDLSRAMPQLAGLVTGCALVSYAPAVLANAAINKFFSPISVNPGDVSTLTVVLYNSNTTPLTAAAVTDNLPVGMTIAPNPNITNTCGGSVGAIAGSTNASLTGGTVPGRTGFVDGSCQFTVDVVSVVSGNSVNTIPANALTTAQGQTSPQAASATLQVKTLSAISASKAFAPNTIPVAGVSRLTITLNNGNAINVPGTALTDNLPAGVTLAATPSPTTTCGGTVTAVPGAFSVSLAGGNIPASGNCQVTVLVTASSAASFTNSVPAGAITNSRGITNTSAFTATLNAQADAPISKSFSPTSIFQGQPSTLTITINNAQFIALTNAAVTDSLPAGLQIANPPTASTTCTGGTVSATAAGTSVSLSGATIPAASTPVGGTSSRGVCTFRFNVTNVTGVTGTRTNTIPASALTNTQNVTNIAAATANLTINALAGGGSGMTLSKSFGTTAIAPGATSVLTIQITNNAGVAVSSLGVTDNLPTGVVLAATPSASTTCSGGSVTAPAGGGAIVLSGASLNSGSNCRVTVTVTGNTPGVYGNTIPAGGITTAQGNSNASAATANLTILDVVSVSKAFFPSTIVPGGRSRLTLTLSNALTTAITNAAITDNLPTGAQVVTVASSPNPTTTCGGTVTANAGGGSVRLTGGTIPAQVGAVPGICTVSVDVTSPNTGTSTNTISANTLTNDQGRTNFQTSTATLTKTNMTVNLNKAISPVAIQGGDPAVLTVTITNPNAAPLSSLRFVDNMPAGMVVAAVPNATTTCSGGSVSATPNGTSFTVTGVSLTAGQTCTVSVNITNLVAGNTINTIPANGVTTQEGATNASAASATLTTLASAALSKAFTPNSISAGTVATLTINVLNANLFPLTNAALTDNLPAGLTIAPTANASTTCAGGTVTATSGATSVALSGATVPANGLCSVTVSVKASVSGTYTNTLAAGTLSTNEGITNPKPTSDVLTVIADVPALVLVKRITAINTVNVPTSVDDPGSTNDNAANWPTPLDASSNISTYLRGALNGGVVRPGDVLEYTIYFLSAGSVPSTNINLCDLVPTNSTFVPNSFSGAPESGINLTIGATSTNLTNVPDSDEGQFFNPGATPSVSCAAANTNGAVVVNVVKSPANLPNATAPGTPTNSYGFIRFRARVN